MRYAALAAVIALALTSVVQAQTTPNPADEAKFKSADKNGNGTLEGAETDGFKASMTQIDTNTDGKITREEFLAASKSGVVK